MATTALAEAAAASSLDADIARGFDAIGSDDPASGGEAAAIARLEAQRREGEGVAAYWQALGLLYRSASDPVPALDAIARAHALAPDDMRVAQAEAQIRLEAGQDSASRFAALLARKPDPALARGLAAALAQEGDRAAAIATLDDALARWPDWLDGHWMAARMRWQQGDDAAFLASLDRAQALRPGDTALWRLRLAILQRGLMHDRAIADVQQALRACPGDLDLLEMGAASLSEMGRFDAAEGAFARVGAARSTDGAVFRMRHALRRGEPERCAALGQAMVAEGQGAQAWPYLAIAWRVMGDPAAAWLEQADGLVATYDLAEALPMAELAASVAGLHHSGAHPLEQSVRGGTQTEAPFFFNPDPPIQNLRRLIAATVRQHVAALGPRDAAHPQLAPRRDAPVRFAGAWSIRMTGGGRHVPHVHPLGWFSSAFYLAVPDERAGDAPDAGWLTLGEPEETLGVALLPLRQIEPKVGRLVLFPSTLWHGTRPIAGGTRMSVAFDVARPQEND